MAKRPGFTFRLSDDLRAALEAIAIREERSMAWLIEKAVRRPVERDQEVHGDGLGGNGTQKVTAKSRTRPVSKPRSSSSSAPA